MIKLSRHRAARRLGIEANFAPPASVRSGLYRVGEGDLEPAETFPPQDWQKPAVSEFSLPHLLQYIISSDY